MVDHGIGELVQARVSEMGVQPFYKNFEHDGVRWFHTGGIFATLGGQTAELIVEGMQSVRASGTITSFDLNYCGKLWKTLEGGEGFCSGLVYGLVTGRDPQEALLLGWAHGALLTTFTGDVSKATLSEVEALASGGSARVQR